VQLLFLLFCFCANLAAMTPDAGRAEEFGEECGGKGGVPYCVFATPETRIKKVTIWHREYVDGMQLETQSGILPKIGGSGDTRDIREDKFELADGEVITGISVEYWQYVDRITFHTNKQDFGPYGGDGGVVKKTINAPPGAAVVGFKGRHWKLIDSIQLMV